MSAVGSGKEINFFFIRTLVKIDSVGRVTLLPGTRFLYIYEAFKTTSVERVIVSNKFPSVLTSAP